MNVDAYINDGWGLSKQSFIDLTKVLDTFNTPTIVEFGSGVSTRFFIDYLNSNKKEGKVYSFEENEHFKPNITDSKLNLKVKKIVECNEVDYQGMFLTKTYDATLMKERTRVNHRTYNYFYDLKDGDLPEEIDLVMIDGPCGFGRTISFLHLQSRLKSGSIVMIDDSDRQEIVNKFHYFFPNTTLLYSGNDNSNKWVTGGYYKIYRID